MDELLPELLDIIFSNLNCKSLIIVSRTCKKFNVKHIIEKKKYDGFPRKEGKCKLHQITDKLLIDLIKDPNINSITTNYVYDNKMDIIRGDIVIITKPCNVNYVRLDNDYKVSIFDGLKLIDTNNKLLPSEFQVIKNNVPINYWYNNQMRTWCVFNVYSIWFDHSSVKNECLNNIKYGLQFDNPNNYSLYTYFNYNNKIYYILCDYLESDTQDLSENINYDNYEIINEETKFIFTCEFYKKLNSDHVEFETHHLFTDNENSLLIRI
jgi:hypothetical protein